MKYGALLIATSTALSAAPTPAAAGNCEFFITPDGGQAYFEPFVIFFDRDSARIDHSAAAVLDNAAQSWRGFSGFDHCVMVVTSHTDRTGSADDNLALSRRRAAAAAAYLQRHGLNVRFRLEPFGEARLLVETRMAWMSHRTVAAKSGLAICGTHKVRGSPGSFKVDLRPAEPARHMA